LRGIAVVVIVFSLIFAVVSTPYARASTPIVVVTLPADNYNVSSARLNGDLVDLGMEDTFWPPNVTHGPTTAVGPGFNTVGTIDTSSNSPLLLIIVGGCPLSSALTGVVTSPVDTIQKLPNSGILVPGGEGNISDAFFVVNPQPSPTYQVTAQWSTGSCSYGSKYVTLYTFNGVNTTTPMSLNQNTTANNVNGFSPFTVSFANPPPQSRSIFTEVTTDDEQNFRDIHLVNMTGLTNAWTYGSAGNCGSGGGWCPAGGIGNSRTAVTFTNFNIDYAAASWLINGNVTTAPRTYVEAYFEFGISQALGQATSHQPETAPATFSATITVAVGTVYYFRACANGTATVSCGVILTFTASGSIWDSIVGGFCVFTFAFGLMLFLIAALMVKRKRTGG